MELSDLAAYAEEHFNIREQHKWAAFPGFSVLAMPESGRWVALLMSRWDADLGEMIQCCDIKCGREVLREAHEAYIVPPFRMTGPNWVGVSIGSRTRPEVVFKLLERAVHLENPGAYTMVLENKATDEDIVYADEALPFNGQFLDTDPMVPEAIRKMRTISKPGDRWGTFYRQARFMQDYEDNELWSGNFFHYYATYADLNVRQLRGYFAWRTNVRKGRFLPIATSLAYIYLYELINGVGVTSAEEAIKKLRAFEVGFLDTGIGDERMRGNLRRWMLDYAFLNAVPLEVLKANSDPAMFEKDEALAALARPDEASDEAIANALAFFVGKRLGAAGTLTQANDKNVRLWGNLWRTVVKSYDLKGKSFFKECFGSLQKIPYWPLYNALFVGSRVGQGKDYPINAVRGFYCERGTWRELTLGNNLQNREKLFALVHEAERVFRDYLKQGRRLKAKPQEAWATPYAEEVIQEERRLEREAARSALEINRAGLDKIRLEAGATRDKLLTEEEMAESVTNESSSAVALKSEIPSEAKPLSALPREVRAPSEAQSSVRLEPFERQVLLELLSGRSPLASIKAAKRMPSVVADALNEVFFDEIGDNIVESNGESISLIEDYREDLQEILGI